MAALRTSKGDETTSYWRRESANRNIFKLGRLFYMCELFCRKLDDYIGDWESCWWYTKLWSENHSQCVELKLQLRYCTNNWLYLASFANLKKLYQWFSWKFHLLKETASFVHVNEVKIVCDGARNSKLQSIIIVLPLQSSHLLLNVRCVITFTNPLDSFP